MNQTNTNGGASVGGDNIGQDKISADVGDNTSDVAIGKSNQQVHTGDVNAPILQSQGNIENIGRDKIINNIVIVGRLLEFAQIEGLLPKLKDNDFSSIVEAVEGALNNRLEGDLTKAVAFAGEILSEFVEESLIQYTQYTDKPVPLAQFVSSLVDNIGHKLRTNGYWEAYSEKCYYGNPTYREISVLQLDTLMMSLAKNIDSASYFGIMYDPDDVDEAWYQLVKGREYITPTARKIYTICSPRAYRADVLRVFIVGIVLDLIRIYSDNTISVQFIQELSAMLKSRQE